MSYYRYPRENHKCGYSSTGHPCQRGPIRNQCSRITSNEESPVCRPVRTLLWWTRTIQIYGALLAVVFVSLAWSNLGRRSLLAPGALSSPHAQLLIAEQGAAKSPHSIDANNRCSACHTGFDEGLAGEIHSNQNASKQSELCLRCHSQTMPDAVHGSPHDLQGESLQALVERGDAKESKSLVARLVSQRPIHWQNKPTECSQCHREHQGEMHSLHTISSEKCQACHRNQFHSFSNGHPEFGRYPYASVQNISFDHNRHRELHFSKKNAEFDCAKCHVPDGKAGAVGEVLRSVSFEKSCASCHSEPIKSALQDGLIVLQLPSVDKQALAKAGLDIGVWPTQASQMNDGTIPPIMRWLLEAEPLGSEMLSKLPASGRLSDVNLNDSEQRESLVKLVQTTKYLMRKLANTGQPGFRSSVEKLVSISVDSRVSASTTNDDKHVGWLDRFASGLPPDLFRAAYSEWFPPPDPMLPQSASRAPISSPAPVRLSTQIRPVDDDLLSVGSDLLGKPNTESTDKSLLNASDNLLDAATPDAFSELSSKKPTHESPFQDPKAWDQLSYGGWMIDRQRMAIVYVPRGHADEWLSRWTELDEIRRQMVQNRPEINSPPIAIFSQNCRACHAFSPVERSLSLTSSSRSTSKTWLTSFRQANERPNHQTSVGSQLDNNQCWKARKQPFNLTPITRFDHTPHLSLPATRGCVACHELRGVAVAVGVSDGVSGGVPSSSPTQADFAPMSRAQCATCHQPKGASEACTQCHNYHVGQTSWSTIHDRVKLD